MRSRLSLLCAALAAICQLAAVASCRAQFAPPAESSPAVLVAGARADDPLVASSFRVLIDRIIGDSADRVCVSVADTDAPSPHLPDDAVDRDPAESVLRSLRGGPVTVIARSVCAADERNFGPSRALLRLRQVALAADGSMTIDADAIGDHFARYRCVARQVAGRPRDARCRITSRD